MLFNPIKTRGGTVGLPWDIKGVPSDHSLIGGGGVNTHFLGEHVSFILVD